MAQSIIQEWKETPLSNQLTECVTRTLIVDEYQTPPMQWLVQIFYREPTANELGRPLQTFGPFADPSDAVACFQRQAN